MSCLQRPRKPTWLDELRVYLDARWSPGDSRTRVAKLFPNEASLLRLASAVLVETSEEWETGKTCLKLETT